MDAVIRTHLTFKGTAKCIQDENIRLVNACRLWLREVHVEDLLLASGEVNNAFLDGTRQCDTDLNFPHQPRPLTGSGKFGNRL